jgi:hypothetical protein
MKCVRVATMAGNWWKAEDSIDGKPSIFLFQTSSSKSELSFVDVVD